MMSKNVQNSSGTTSASVPLFVDVNVIVCTLIHDGIKEQVI
jgi:hypothetical protein